MNDGALYFITGMAGAGKTVISKQLVKLLKAEKPNVVFLDGDILREVFMNDLGYSVEERRKSANRNIRLAKLLTSQGIDVVLATISMFSDVRQWCRDNIKNYYEIFINPSMETLISRDQKGIYSDVISGRTSHVVGMDIDLDIPRNPDMIIYNDGGQTPEQIAKAIFKKFYNKE